jgi:hypothetical protein
MIHKELNKKAEAQQIIEGRSARAGRATPYAFIHSIQGYILPYSDTCMEIHAVMLVLP